MDFSISLLYFSKDKQLLFLAKRAKTQNRTAVNTITCENNGFK